jgi:hypothetical protein
MRTPSQLAADETMTAGLFLDWHVRRLGSSGVISVVGCIIMAAAVVWLSLTNDAKRLQLDNLLESASIRVDARASGDDLRVWRTRLTNEEIRLPERAQGAALVRKALDEMEKAGGAIASLATSTSKAPGSGYETLTLDARISTSAGKAAGAVAAVLATSPGWALERLTLERRDGEVLIVEATFSLLMRDAS